MQCHYEKCHYAKCHHVECRYAKFPIFSSYALIGIMLCVIILNVSMMCATFYIVMLIGIMGESRSAECHILYLYVERCAEWHFGATTFSITPLSITTFSITSLSIKGILFLTQHK